MALTKVINDLADLNQSGSTNALKGCAGTTAQQPASNSTVDYLIVGGGGAGGEGSGGGGGGAGGIVTGTNNPVYHGTPTVITVGEGGIGSDNPAVVVANGNDSGFNGLRAIGGGGGGSETAGYKDGQLGASGGGGNYTAGDGGAALQGNIGGIGGSGNPDYTGGGGGGNSGLGQAGGGSSGGPGSGSAGSGGVGTDYTSFISVVNANLAQIGDTSNGTQVYFAGGGGGGSQSGSSPGTPGTGGLGGGGTGMPFNVVAQLPSVDEDGLRNSGGGAGGGAGWGGTQLVSPNGGSGVVALKYDNTEITGYSLNSGDTVTVNWPAGAFGIAYWPLNLNVKDIGGNYDGTAEDVTYSTGYLNQAAVFDGSTSNIVVPNIRTIINNNFSISFWMRTGTSLSSQVIIGMYGYNASDPTGSGTGWSIEYIGGNKFMFYWVYSQSAGAQLDSPVLTADTWYHVTVTKDSSSTKLYLNGNLEASSTSNTTLYYGHGAYFINDVTFGGRHLIDGGSFDQPFEGRLEQMRIYGSALTVSNITDIYNNSKPGTLPPLKTASDITTSTCNFPSGVTGTALYKFEGNANDSCTVGPYNGISTVNDPSYVNGKFGTYAASFNGSTSILDTTYTLSSTTFSASCWVKFGTQSLGYETIITCTDDSAGAGNDGFTIAADKCLVNQNDAFPYTAEIAYTATVNDNVWHNIVVTNDGTTLKVYIDGVLDGSISSTGWTDYGTNPLVFGYQPRSPVNQWYNGLIDQVRMYNTALTAANVYDLWQKENDIQTYFPNTPTSGTDTLVFKSGSGEISFINDTAPGAEVGMLRYNSTLGKMEHFNSGGWKSLSKVINFVIVDYLIVAGGGGGAEGGGGAGGLRTSWPGGSGGGTNSEDPVELSLATNYTITVGLGGSGGPSTANGGEIGTSGNPSSVDTIISLGGGRGGGSNPTSAGALGGSGGGGKRDNESLGGDGTLNQGYAGGPSTAPGGPPWWIGGGGGGGASAAGAAGSGGSSASEAGGNGGNGLSVDITGASVTYAGGGGGGCEGSSGNGGSGGSGGGGNGGGISASVPGAGSANTGSGGGGTSKNSNTAGDGGSGIVILRYPNTYTLTNNSTGTLTTGVINQAVGTDKYTTFTAGTGNISFS